MADLLFFGRLHDLANGGAFAMPLTAPLSVAAIIEVIATDDRLLAGALAEPDIRYAANGVFVGPDQLIANGDELAFLPPVSGG